MHYEGIPSASQAWAPLTVHGAVNSMSTEKEFTLDGWFAHA